MQPVLVAQTQPIAPYTATRKLALSHTAANHLSNSETLHFLRGVEIVGFVVTVGLSGAGGQGLVTPTLEDIELRIESNDLRLTRDHDETADADGFADAAALCLPLRYIIAKLTGSPDIRVQARWKNPSHSTIFNDAIVSVSILYNWE